MKGSFWTPAPPGAAGQDDALLYEVYEIKRPEIAGELLNASRSCIRARWATSIHDQGHFHTCWNRRGLLLPQRRGVMVMERRRRVVGRAAAPNAVLYVRRAGPPLGEHQPDRGPRHVLRVSGTRATTMHDRDAGLRKLVVEREGAPAIATIRADVAGTAGLTATGMAPPAWARSQ